jgi:hypothetical protein
MAIYNALFMHCHAVCNGRIFLLPSIRRELAAEGSVGVPIGLYFIVAHRPQSIVLKSSKLIDWRKTNGRQ